MIGNFGNRRILRGMTIATMVFASLFWMVRPADACNIPVFRYALERWRPDRIEFVIFSDGNVSQSATQTLDRLQRSASGPQNSINAKLVHVDVSGPIDAPYDALWAGAKAESKSLPYLIIRTKVGGGRFANHFRSPLDQVDWDVVNNSPVRDELCNRLLAGHSIVWLIVQSNDATKNQAAEKMLAQSFKSLESEVQLPEGIGLPGSELYADVPLVVRFSTLKLDPSDPDETYLTQLLTGLRSEAWQQNEPLLVPVFGRARALEVLSAGETTPTMIKELTLFLAGACSCQVKEQNPGFDLLVESDWDGELFGGAENRPPDRSDIEGTNRPPTLVPIPSGRR